MGCDVMPYIHHTITLISHFGWFHDLGICQLYHVGPLNNGDICVLFIHSGSTWKVGWGAR